MAKEGALVILRGPDGAQEWPVEHSLVIGRGPMCDVRLIARQVSRRHATIARVEGGYELHDEESKNGTWLNGSPVEGTVRLSDGDEISIAARFKLYFVDAEATAPLVFVERGLRIDPETLSVYVRGEPLDPPLSGPQWELVRLLYDADGALVTRDDIIERVWPEEDAGGVSEDAVDALVRRVRKRLTDSDPEHQYIVTVRGYGFRLDNV